MHADVVRRLELAADLQRALGNQFALRYQPVVELATSRVTAVEALVRWWRGDQLVPPEQFLGAAEDTGLIVPLGEWMLREACGGGAAWRRPPRSGGHRALGEPVGPADLAAPAFRPGGGDPGRRRAAARCADPRGHRGDAGRGGRAIVGGWPSCAGSAYGWPSTTSAPATPRWPCCAGSRWTSSRSIPRSCPAFGDDETLTLLTRTSCGSATTSVWVIAEGIERPGQLALREMGCTWPGLPGGRPMGARGVDALDPDAGG